SVGPSGRSRAWLEIHRVPLERAIQRACGSDETLADGCYPAQQRLPWTGETVEVVIPTAEVGGLARQRRRHRAAPMAAVCAQDRGRRGRRELRLWRHLWVMRFRQAGWGACKARWKNVSGGAE
ncbi:MAG: hypothetical protein AAF211_02725, partial [Myxococcota bacterium]